MAAERLHGDDTTVPVLAKGKTATGRLWVYVRDDRPFAGGAPPAAMFRFSRDRKGEHPEKHLEHWSGVLQADAYAGFRALYAADRKPAPVTEALCWGHARRKFFELADIASSARRGKDAPPISPIALEAVTRIDAIFGLERTINGSDAKARHAARQRDAAPLQLIGADRAERGAPDIGEVAADELRREAAHGEPRHGAVLPHHRAAARAAHRAGCPWSSRSPSCSPRRWSSRRFRPGSRCGVACRPEYCPSIIRRLENTRFWKRRRSWRRRYLWLRAAGWDMR
jgi:hypothetical protein